MNFEEITKLYDFSGKSVLLTGGAGVLTGEIACAMFGCNANIAIIDRDPALAETVMKRLEPVGDRAIVVYGDVLQPETMQQALAQVIRAFGKVDYLVNGAEGTTPGRQRHRPPRSSICRRKRSDSCPTSICSEPSSQAR